MKEKEENENLNEIITSTSTLTEEEENAFEFLKELKIQFKIIKFVNKSNISRIYHAQNIKENRNAYLKVIEKKKLENNYEEFMETIKREEEIIRLCESDNIINIFQKIETKNYIIFELEYCGKDLSTYIKEKGPLKNKFEKFKYILNEISKSIKILNIFSIIHRDIKPSNIFIVDEEELIKLGGFGCAIHKE